jgi:predicted amidophosphoribosyltransferase
MSLANFTRNTFASLVDLVLPADCAGCGGRAGLTGVCEQCGVSLAQPAFATRPTPVPPWLPPCYTAAGYDGVVRELILAYKEHGRRGLAGPLGAALARAVLAGLPVRPEAGSFPVRPQGALALVPVPSTAAAVRARQGDHMLRLARTAVAVLRREGLPATVQRPLHARPRADSAHLGRAERAAAAGQAFVVRPGNLHQLRSGVVLLDDVLTTGATLAAVARGLQAERVPVWFAATVAATRLRGFDARLSESSSAVRGIGMTTRHQRVSVEGHGQFVNPEGAVVHLPNP